MLQAVIFDFDGVIADSEPLHLRAYQTILQPEGIELSREDYYQQYLGYDDEELFRTLARDRGLSIKDATIDKWIADKSTIVDKLLSSDAILFPGAAECIRMFAARVPLAIASGALEHEIVRVLDSAGLRASFQAIASVSDGVRGKPAPDLYLLAIAKLSTMERVDPRACVAIEDSHWGLEAARTAGLRCVAVTHTYAAADLSAADLVIDRLADLSVERLEVMLRDNNRS